MLTFRFLKRFATGTSTSKRMGAAITLVIQQNLSRFLKGKGSSLVDSAEAADSVIINTCTVVGPTERRMLRRLSQFREYDLYVTGCMPEVQREVIFAVCTPTFLPSEIIHEGIP